MKKLIKDYDLVVRGTSTYDDFGRRKWDNAEGSRKGSVFTLAFEPDNPIDPLAISVNFKDKPLGYVARSENIEVAHYLSLPDQFSVVCKQVKKIDNDRYIELIVIDIQVFAIVEDYTPFSVAEFNKNFPDYFKIIEDNYAKINEAKRLEAPNNPVKKPVSTANKKGGYGCLKYGLIIIGLFIAFWWLSVFLFAK